MRAPASGRLVLRADAADATYRHTVWLWEEGEDALP